jgi:hypothetical protein
MFYNEANIPGGRKTVYVVFNCPEAEASSKVSVYNVYITNQFQPTFAQGGGGVKSISRGDCE